MLAAIGRIIRSLTTEDEDDRVPGLVRYGSIGIVGTYIGAGVHSAVAGSFDFISFGGGAGALLIGVAGALWGEAKATAVPSKPPMEPPRGGE